MNDPLRETRLNASVKAGLLLLGLMYAIALFAEFFAPYNYREQTRGEPSAPATSIRFIDANGAFHVRPFIYPSRLTNPREVEYTED
ncbi:MAG TPA: hypothetical protein VGI80_04675, partial [Pyrinomonadaceae bacterium]